MAGPALYTVKDSPVSVRLPPLREHNVTVPEPSESPLAAEIVPPLASFAHAPADAEVVRPLPGYGYRARFVRSTKSTTLECRRYVCGLSAIGSLESTNGSGFCVHSSGITHQDVLIGLC